jgi:hypothetical protein
MVLGYSMQSVESLGEKFFQVEAMKPTDLFAAIADRLTLIVKNPYREQELSIEELECCLDSLTVFLGNLLAEKRKGEQ